jgi:hypothetical protein
MRTIAGRCGETFPFRRLRCARHVIAKSSGLHKVLGGATFVAMLLVMTAADAVTARRRRRIPV